MSDLIVLANHAIQYQTPLFQCLHERFGVDVQIVYLQEPAVEEPYWDDGFDRYVQWDIPLTEGYPWSVLSPGNLGQRLAAFVRQHRIHGRPPVFLLGWGTPLHWAIWTWATLAKVPILQAAETNRLSYALHARPLWRHLWLCFLIRRTAALLCIGRLNREFYEWMGACQAHLYPFPYSVDNDRFMQVYLRRLGERQSRLAQLGLDPSLPVLLFCGKLIRLKRVDLLLDAVSMAGLAQHVNILVVGDGELREELQVRARGLGLEHVAFLGFLNQSEMPLAYVLGDLLCLLSDVPETWGLVVNEALVCGRPVMVSSHCGCVPDLVEEKGTGWIVPPGNVVATSRALRDAVTHAARWPEMGRRGQAVVAHHTFEAMAQGLTAALHKL